MPPPVLSLCVQDGRRTLGNCEFRVIYVNLIDGPFVLKSVILRNVHLLKS
jgi:hypothetical protein